MAERRSTAKQNTTVDAASTSATVLAANPNRTKVILSNDSDAKIWLALGTSNTGAVPTAVINSGITLPIGAQPFVLEGFTGAIAAISVAGSKALGVVEI